MIQAWTDGGAVHATSDQPVPWWSLGKTVLAAAALVLVGQGRVQLDTPMPGRPFTLRQVLQHRAGLGCYGGLRAYHEAVLSNAAPWAEAEMLARADRMVTEPGQAFGYSNVGYTLVRRMIEREVGRPLGDALAQLVFAPLGFRGVMLARTPGDLASTAWGNTSRYDPAWVYHGLLVGPAAASVLLLQRLLAGGLLPPALLAAMRGAEPVGGPIPGRPWRRTGYGLGLMIGKGEPPGHYEGHTGSGPGSSAAVYQGPARIAAAFAATEDVGLVERHATTRATAERLPLPSGEGWGEGHDTSGSGLVRL